jgi:ribonuclease HI
MNAQHKLDAVYPFPDNVVIQDRASAIRCGHDIFDQGVIDRCLVVWVDASVEKYPSVRKANRLAVAAVRYLDLSSKSWTELVTLNSLPYGSAFAAEAEMIAIYEAFHVACKLVDDLDRVIIFSDCQSILQGLKSESSFGFLARPYWLMSLLTYANMLYDVGITAELRWIPAHSSVEGNERVDELAKRYRRSAQSILARDRPDLILHHVTIAPSSTEIFRQLLLTISNEKNDTEGL